MKIAIVLAGLFVLIEAIGSIWYPLNDKSRLAQVMRGFRALVGIFIIAGVCLVVD